MDYAALLEQIKNFANSHFNLDSGHYCYHEQNHTENVVKAVQEMVEYYNLTPEQSFIVQSAAYFHDLGYFTGGNVGHERRSADLAEEYLSKMNVHEDVINQVKGCIIATKLPQNPQNLLESILCDADMFHLGKSDFWEKSKLMHKEIVQTHSKKVSKSLWRHLTIELLQAHHYHTEFAKNKLDKKKTENLELLLKDEKKSKEKGAELKKPERGIETMFRITSANNQRLSDMADNKANILLTVNSIILSLVVTVLLGRLDHDTHLLIPSIILMVIVVLTMIFAILSTIPKIPNGTSKIEDIEKKKVNLLFFGNFYKMSYPDYEFGMNKTMENSEILYGMLTKDVFSQGVSLGRKYVLLRYAYGIFMFGLIISVIAFCIAIIEGK